MADHPTPLAGEIQEGRDLALLPDAHQLELLRDQDPKRDAGDAVRQLERRGRGRPPGAINKRSAKFRDQILAMCNGNHPALTLARVATTPVELLAAQLQCTRLEAATLATRSAMELLPYMEGKAPIAVDIRRRNDVVVIMPGADVSDATIEALQADLAGEEAIDWESMTVVEALPSLSGGPQTDVSPGPSSQTGE